MKKLMAGFLILCISVAVLTACGGGGGNGSDSNASPEISANPGDVYRVITVDENKAPVPGVMVQFCSDELCVMGETGDDGIVVFEDQAEGSYTVHIYSVPEGYAEDDTEYEVPEKYGDLTIVIAAAQ